MSQDAVAIFRSGRRGRALRDAKPFSAESKDAGLARPTVLLEKPVMGHDLTEYRVRQAFARLLLEWQMSPSRRLFSGRTPA